MSAKTKIVVLHMKKIITTSVIAGVSLLLVLLIVLALHNESDSSGEKNTENVSGQSSSSSDDASKTAEDLLQETLSEQILDNTAQYIPGVYHTSVQLSDSAIDIKVVVDEANINSISIVNLDKELETMYPLLSPALENLSSQILDKQSTRDLHYTPNSQYTSIVLLRAIEDALKKAVPE